MILAFIGLLIILFGSIFNHTNAMIFGFALMLFDLIDILETLKKQIWASLRGIEKALREDE